LNSRRKGTKGRVVQLTVTVADVSVLWGRRSQCGRQDAKCSQVQPRMSHPSLDTPLLPLWEDRGCLQLEQMSTLSLWTTTSTTCNPPALSAFPIGGMLGVSWSPSGARRVKDFSVWKSHHEYRASQETSGPASQIPSASLSPLYLFLMVTSVTLAASATSFCVLSSPSSMQAT
jgi:hypothetical protein